MPFQAMVDISSRLESTLQTSPQQAATMEAMKKHEKALKILCSVGTSIIFYFSLQ